MKKIAGKSLALAAAVGMTAATVGATMAYAGMNEQAVLVRQAVMRDLGARMGAVKGYLQDGQGTAEDAAGAMTGMAELAMFLKDAFPEGTSTDDAVPTNRAKPDIWAEWDKFEAAADDLSTRASDLAATLAAGDMDAAMAQFGDVGKEGCGGCHKPFRVPKD